MSDRLAVMSQGRSKQIGYPDDIYGRPRRSIVAGFIVTPRTSSNPPFVAAPRPPTGEACARLTGSWFAAPALTLPLPRQHARFHRRALELQSAEVVAETEPSATNLCQPSTGTCHPMSCTKACRPQLVVSDRCRHDPWWCCRQNSDRVSVLGVPRHRSRLAGILFNVLLTYDRPHPQPDPPLEKALLS